MDRLNQEKLVIRKMIREYCKRYHHPASGDMCEQCTRLLTYAETRLERCPKGKNKSSCRKCDIHCYAPQEREMVREVMRKIGPKMLFIDPVAAIRHLLNELR